MLRTSSFEGQKCFVYMLCFVAKALLVKFGTSQTNRRTDTTSPTRSDNTSHETAMKRCDATTCGADEKAPHEVHPARPGEARTLRTKGAGEGEEGKGKGTEKVFESFSGETVPEPPYVTLQWQTRAFKKNRPGGKEGGAGTHESTAAFIENGRNHVEL